MVTVRDFDARPRSAAKPSGEFRLGGVTWKIRARSEVPYALMEQLLGTDDDVVEFDPDEFRSLPPEEQAAKLREYQDRYRRVVVQTDEFFAATISPEQVDDFLAMVHDPAGPYTVELAGEVTALISNCLFGGEEPGPTVPSRPSRPGRRTTGSTSKAGSSSRVTPRGRSAN